MTDEERLADRLRKCVPGGMCALAKEAADALAARDREIAELNAEISAADKTLDIVLRERDAARAQVAAMRAALVAANEALHDSDAFRAHQYVRAALDSPGD